MKKNILVPTDFSDNARAATRYALALAERLGYHVHIVHVYAVFRSAFQNQETHKTDEQRAASEATAAMEAFIESLGALADAVSLSTSLQPGNLADAVLEHTRANPDVLVVMGTHGATGSRLGLLGTNTYDIAKAVKTPLLVVPAHCGTFAMQSMVFFSDFQARDIQTLSGYAALFGNLAQRNTVVHIAGKDAEAPDSQERKRIAAWKTELQEASGLENLDAQVVIGKESVALVHETLDEHDADLTVLTLVGGRGFFEKLVTKSLARAIILHPKTPILLVN